jgi:catechol 2,3-dioxygenase-like lactoylglutathione lyase family enzyme
MIVGIDHVQLAMPAGLEAKAREFYSGVLGIPEVPKPVELAGRGGAWFESGTVKIHLGVDADFRPAKKAHPGLLVDDISEVVRALTDSGYHVRLENPQRAYVDDPFGNRIELVQNPA